MPFRTRLLAAFLMALAANFLTSPVRGENKGKPSFFVHLPTKLKSFDDMPECQKEYANILGGIEWNSSGRLPLRFGFAPGGYPHTSFAQHFGLGTALSLFGHEVHYTWAPFQGNGQTHYLSVSWKF